MAEDVWVESGRRRRDRGFPSAATDVHPLGLDGDPGGTLGHRLQGPPQVRTRADSSSGTGAAHGVIRSSTWTSTHRPNLNPTCFMMPMRRNPTASWRWTL